MSQVKTMIRDARVPEDRRTPKPKPLSPRHAIATCHCGQHHQIDTASRIAAVACACGTPVYEVREP